MGTPTVNLLEPELRALIEERQFRQIRDALTALEPADIADLIESLEPDEAVVLELTPPECRLWSLSLCDRHWQSIDFTDRQSSLNGSQATLTGDGRFVGVISHDDPGVANWLDPGGETEGTLAVRYLLPDALPTVSYRAVRRAELDSAVPPDTPRVTPDVRQASLRARRRAVQHRYGR